MEMANTSESYDFILKFIEKESESSLKDLIDALKNSIKDDKLKKENAFSQTSLSHF